MEEGGFNCQIDHRFDRLNQGNVKVRFLGQEHVIVRFRVKTCEGQASDQGHVKIRPLGQGRVKFRHLGQGRVKVSYRVKVMERTLQQNALFCIF